MLRIEPCLEQVLLSYVLVASCHFDGGLLKWSRWTLSLLCNVVRLWTCHALVSWVAGRQTCTTTLPMLFSNMPTLTLAPTHLKREARGLMSLLYILFSSLSRRATSRDLVGERLIMNGIYCLDYFLLDSKVYHVSLLFPSMNIFIYFFVMKQVDGELAKGDLGFTARTHLRSQCW